MPRRSQSSDLLDALVRDAAGLDSPRIDELYGLEPVFEPGEGGGGSAQSVREFVEIGCPSCGEVFGINIDPTSADRSYIEDCQVCCAPMMITIELDTKGHFAAVTTQKTE